MTTPGQPGGILAIDIGLRTGWAYGHPGGVLRPAWGFWRMPDEVESDGMRGMRFQNALADRLALLRPSVLAFAVRVGMIQTSAYLLTGLAFCAEVEAERQNVRSVKVAEGAARKAVLGRGSFGARDTKGKLVKGASSDATKDAVMAYCERMHWDVPNHDVGDALVILQYQADQEARRFRPAAA